MASQLSGDRPRQRPSQYNTGLWRGRDLLCSDSLHTNTSEIAKNGQSGPYPTQMSAFPKSGRSDRLNSAEIRVCLRPKRPLGSLHLAHHSLTQGVITFTSSLSVGSSKIMLSWERIVPGGRSREKIFANSAF